MTQHTITPIVYTGTITPKIKNTILKHYPKAIIYIDIDDKLHLVCSNVLRFTIEKGQIVHIHSNGHIKPL